MVFQPDYPFGLYDARTDLIVVRPTIFSAFTTSKSRRRSNTPRSHSLLFPGHRELVSFRCFISTRRASTCYLPLGIVAGRAAIPKY
jgi:hypothetical protein